MAVEKGAGEVTEPRKKRHRVKVDVSDDPTGSRWDNDDDPPETAGETEPAANAEKKVSE